MSMRIGRYNGQPVKIIGRKKDVLLVRPVTQEAVGKSEARVGKLIFTGEAFEIPRNKFIKRKLFLS